MVACPMFDDFCHPLQVEFAHLHYIILWSVLVRSERLSDFVLEHFLEQFMKHALEGACLLATKTAAEACKFLLSRRLPHSRSSQIEGRLNFWGMQLS